MKFLLTAFVLSVLSATSVAQGFDPCRTFFWTDPIQPTISHYQMSFLIGEIPLDYPELRSITGSYVHERWSKKASECLFNESTELASGLFTHSSYVNAPTLGKVLLLLDSLQKANTPSGTANYQSRLNQAKVEILKKARDVVGGFENFYAASALTCQALNGQSEDIDSLINFYNDRDIFTVLSEEFCSESNRQKLADIRTSCETKLDASCNLEDLYAEVQDCTHLADADPRKLLDQLKDYQELIKTAATGCASYRRNLRLGLDQLKTQL